MKTVKNLLLIGFVTALMVGCFNPPEYSAIPSISLNELYFREVGTNSDPDSLVMSIQFRDGDGDLGLGSTDITGKYAEIFYPLDKDNKLITIRTREKVGYDTLPAFTTPFNCLVYLYDSVYVPESDKGVFDKTYNLVDSFNTLSGKVYVLLDTFYIRRNADFYNITVDFMVKNPSGVFERFNWETVYPYPSCGETFNGRFPVLADRNKRNTLEGELKYSMKSVGFVPLLKTKTMKLRIQIKDRELNKSNILETGEFTLQSIKR